MTMNTQKRFQSLSMFAYFQEKQFALRFENKESDILLEGRWDWSLGTSLYEHICLRHLHWGPIHAFSAVLNIHRILHWSYDPNSLSHPTALQLFGWVFPSHITSYLLTKRQISSNAKLPMRNRDWCNVIWISVQIASHFTNGLLSTAEPNLEKQIKRHFLFLAIID